jgi:predicted acylesterase/phospholipase RssA
LGVFKALSKRNTKIDIVAGTPIGGVNAAIIAGSKDEDHAEEQLEQFWLDCCESFVDLKFWLFIFCRSRVYDTVIVELLLLLLLLVWNERRVRHC